MKVLKMTSDELITLRSALRVRMLDLKEKIGVFEDGSGADSEVLLKHCKDSLVKVETIYTKTEELFNEF